MKKTIGEWLNELPSPEKEQAIENTKNLNGGVDILKCKSISLYKALMDAFMWSNSPEGYDYWKAIHANVSKKITW